MKFILRNRCYNFRFTRFYSTKGKKQKKINPYFASFFLPKTSLLKIIPVDKQVESDIKIQKNSNFYDLYSWQKTSDRPKFTTLVAPTMACDKPQMEQVISNIFADIINRYKLLQGYQIQFQPGWNSFSFPSVPTKTASSEEEKNNLRNAVKTEVETLIERQKRSFSQWGIMADWKDCYLSSRNECVETQIRIFWELYEKGLIFRDLKPVYWSPSLRTALAESDLEYVYNHKSFSTYLRIPLCKSQTLSQSVGADELIYALVWTTSLWMLPSCEMILYSETLNYSLVQCENTKHHYLIASNFRKALEQHFSTKFIVKNNFEGNALKSITFIHPFQKTQRPFLHADYVNVEKGTGLMLGNPSHNFADYEIGKENNLPIMSDLVDESGLFTEKGGSLLEGKHIFGKGREAILVALGNDVLSQKSIVGQYLYDQYRKNPVIVRPSTQWFLNIGNLKHKVLDCLEKTEIIPNHLKKNIEKLLDKNSPYWCISRQNILGIPIPVFYDKTNQKPVLNRKLIDHWCKLFQEQGTSVWWTLPQEQLIPSYILNEEKVSNQNELVKGGDFLEPQFDAGVHWKFILKDTGNHSDVCVSGLDQIQGWLQMLLLTSGVLQSKAPFQQFLIHGLSTKESNQKLSKSLKTLNDQWNFAQDSKVKNSKAFGADELRWWAATCALATEDSNIQEEEDYLLEQSSADVRKIRMVLWFLLGNLHGFEEQHLLDYSSMNFIDKYFLHELSDFQSKIQKNYSDYAFDDVAGNILNFIMDDVSIVYLQAVKDRLFSAKKDSLVRRSSQTCCYFLLRHLTYGIAPLLPHLAEEVSFHNPLHGNSGNSLFRTFWTECPREWEKKELKNIMDAILSIKSLVDKIAGSSVRRSSEIIIQGPRTLLNMLETLNSDVRISYSDLPDILEVANVRLIDTPLQESSSYFKGVVKLPKETFQIQLQASTSNYKKCGRCFRFVAENNEVCSQCSQAIEN